MASESVNINVECFLSFCGMGLEGTFGREGGGGVRRHVAIQSACNIAWYFLRTPGQACKLPSYDRGRKTALGHCLSFGVEVGELGATHKGWLEVTY